MPAGKEGGCHLPFPAVVTSMSREISLPGHRGCSWRGDGFVSPLPAAPLCQQESGAVVTSLFPWLSPLCPCDCHISVPVGISGRVEAGVWSPRSSRIPLSLPAALPGGLMRCHPRGHLSPARGGLVPQLFMRNRSLRQLPAPVTPLATGGHRGGGVPAGYHLCHPVTWKGSARLARPLWDFTPVPGSGKHRIPETPGSLRPLLGAVDLSPESDVPRLGPAPAPAHPPY